jgi:transcription elongation GreA/GreB family factor
MSRAFTKEPDGDRVGDDTPDRPRSHYPNYVTRRGLAKLTEALAELKGRRARLADEPQDLAAQMPLAHLDRDIRYVEQRIDSAILVEPATDPAGEVGFGTFVTVEDPAGTRRAYAIVGEDEADAASGLVSWVSPLARALQGARVGDLVTWKRPSGDLELKVVAIGGPPA